MLSSDRPSNHKISIKEQQRIQLERYNLKQKLLKIGLNSGWKAHKIGVEMAKIKKLNPKSLSLFFLKQKLNFHQSKARKAKAEFEANYSDDWVIEVNRYSHYQQYKNIADHNSFNKKFEDFKENVVLASYILAAIANPFGLSPVFIKP